MRTDASWDSQTASVCDAGKVVLAKMGGQMAERLGSRAINWKVAGSIPGHAKRLHHTCLGENVPVLAVSRSG